MERVENFTGVVLAGGKSTRYGSPKSRIEFRGEALAVRAHGMMSRIFERVIVIASESDGLEDFGLPVVRDLVPEKGPLGGIFTALKSIDTEYAFVMACDQPFVSEKLVRAMCGGAKGADVFVPRTGELLYPLFACYSSRCLPHVESYISREILKIILFYPDVETRFADRDWLEEHDPGLRSFFNINTPEDYKKALEMEDPV